jgi:hypothetical protein
MSNRKPYLKFRSHLDAQKNVKSSRGGDCIPIKFPLFTSTSLGSKVNHMIYRALEGIKGGQHMTGRRNG